MSTILIVDDLKMLRDQYAYDIKRNMNAEVLTASNGKEALQIIDDEDVDVIVLDVEMPEMDGLEFLEVMKKRGPIDIPVIVYTGKGNYERCVRAVQLGAYNFFDKNEVKIGQLIRFLENALEHRRLFLENKELKYTDLAGTAIIGNSIQIKSLREQIVKVANIPSTVLIIGESGTGKELVAKEIHRLSPRANKPFVAVNCAAIPETLVESELFGFEKGAFTGAARTTKGKFEIANGGTLFLDEIGDMPLSVQPKLLRVLEETEIHRLGSEGKTINVDVRVIAATHRRLEEYIDNEKFRKDLYYRICTHIITVPPLRDRREDIGTLTTYFVEKTCKRFGIPSKSIDDGVFNVLKSYDWNNNNVRELENIVERMIIQCDGSELLPEHIPSDIRNSLVELSVDREQSFKEIKQNIEKQIVLQYLEQNNWHISNTAKALGISNHSNLLKIMRRLGIKKEG